MKPVAVQSGFPCNSPFERPHQSKADRKSAEFLSTAASELVELVEMINAS
jgi:hypothetical protein